MIDAKLGMTAGLLLLTFTATQSGFYFNSSAKTAAIPRWLPYAVLAVLAVASAVVGVIYPEAIGGNID